MSGLNRLTLAARGSAVRTIQRNSSGGFYGANNFDGFRKSMTSTLRDSDSKFYVNWIYYLFYCFYCTQFLSANQVWGEDCFNMPLLAGKVQRINADRWMLF